MSTSVGVSVLFTDLVGSTALGTSVGVEEAGSIRLLHFGLLRKAVNTHQGTEVKNLGDGVMAVFPGATAALGAAVAMQQAIDRHNRTSADTPLAIRIGVSTGDCSEEDGDYFGEPVIQAARLCARAEAGEILAAAIMRFLVPRDTYEFVDVGELDLKGLPEPVPTLRVEWTSSDGATGAVVPLQSRLTIESVSPLVGREPEREALKQALKAANGGQRRVVLITGEAGLGKTRLTAEFARHALESGAIVLYGRCDEELAVPYLPWIESLGHLVEHAPDADLAALDTNTTTQLARLLPSMEQHVGDDRATAVGDGDQYALIDAVSRLLSSVSTQRTTVVILDDLHWADHATLVLLRHVATALTDGRLVIVGTYRETDLGPDDALTETSARLHRVAGVHRLQLSGLSDTEVVELLEGAAGHAMDDRGVSLAHSLRADSAGNPFFVVEMLRHLADANAIVQGQDGRWTVSSDLADFALPQSVRDVVGQRVRRLGAETQTVLTAAAVMGREFDGAVVASATDIPQERVLDVLEDAMAAGLIAEVPGTADRFTFAHALVQHTLYAELSETRRARMHHRVATVIEQLVGEEPGSRVGELAKHWFAAVRPSELDRAIGYAIKAAERALEASAPDEAVRWYAQALDAIDEEDRELRCEVLTRLGDAERRAGRETYRERLLGAARLAQDVGRDDLLVDAAIHNYRGMHSVSGEVDLDRVEVLESALRGSAGADGANRARLLATLAGELTYSDDHSRFDMAREARQLARSLGDGDVLIDVLERFGSSLNVPDTLAERDRWTAEMMELTRSRHDPVRRFVALDRRTHVLLELADIEGARTCSLERRTIADQLGEPTLRWFATQGTALLDLIEGQIERAMEGASSAHALALETGQPDASVYFGALVIQLEWHRGRFADTIPLIQQAVVDNPGVSTYHPVLALFQAHAGQTNEAARILADLAAERFAFPHDLLWSTSNVIAAEAVSLVGDREAAGLFYERLSPYADQVSASRATCQGPVSYYLGLLATTLEREDAQAHLRDAIDRSGRLGSPFHQARAMIALAGFERNRDPVLTHDLAAQAGELIERYEIGSLSEQVRALTG